MGILQTIWPVPFKSAKRVSKKDQRTVTVWRVLRHKKWWLNIMWCPGLDSRTGKEHLQKPGGTIGLINCIALKLNV